MRYGSLFTGIGGFDLGFTRTGMECAWQVEIDKNCNQLLECRYPGIKRYEDVRECGKHNLDPVDVICGGFPCQDLSVAGKREGLAGERSGLWFEFHRIIAELSPQWVVIENVPGLLSSQGGQDFAVILHGLVECGYGVCWRVLDAQYFGVAQRRRRVFIVGSLGDGRAAQVLFEREGGAGDTPPSRKTGEGTPTATLRGFGHGWQGQHNDTNAVMIARPLAYGSTQNHYDESQQQYVIAHALSFSPTATGRLDPNGQDFVVSGEKMYDDKGIHREKLSFDTTPTLNTFDIPLTGKAYSIQQNDGGDHKRKDRPNGGMYVNEAEKSLTIGSSDQTVITLYGGNKRKDRPHGGFYATVEPTIKTLDQSGLNPTAQQGGVMVGVRRLTPTECERLQGFPDGWTEGFADSTRYRMLGNAVAVPVVVWIGQRVAERCLSPAQAGG